MSNHSPLHQNFLARKSSLESELGEPLSIDGVAGPFRIFQRAKGQRHSIDDAATAWYALQKCPATKSALDLGTGIGSVGLGVLWGLGPEATLTCIEAQEISYKILQANIECNNLGDRIKAINGDLRELNINQKFAVITGSPPYFPADAGVLPSDPQKAYARFELRGDVSDYARVAKRHLTEDGVFVFCFPFQQKSRCRSLVSSTGLKFITIRDIIPHAGKPPLFSLYSARLKWNAPVAEEPPLIVADSDGKYTEDMLVLQKSRGFGALGKNNLT